mmetsp:Transcript_9822/g.38244  ORF Transcript_9822/g.38244 Transcript_9822/m.38244 type:complete len:285 (-) Transcript_9822:349-1203(-)
MAVSRALSEVASSTCSARLTRLRQLPQNRNRSRCASVSERMPSIGTRTTRTRASRGRASHHSIQASSASLDSSAKTSLKGCMCRSHRLAGTPVISLPASAAAAVARIEYPAKPPPRAAAAWKSNTSETNSMLRKWANTSGRMARRNRRSCSSCCSTDWWPPLPPPLPPPAPPPPPLVPEADPSPWCPPVLAEPRFVDRFPFLPFFDRRPDDGPPPPPALPGPPELVPPRPLLPTAASAELMGSADASEPPEAASRWASGSAEPPPPGVAPAGTAWSTSGRADTS